MGLRSHSPDRTGEPEVGYFISDLCASLSFLQQDVLGFDVAMDEVLLMDALESLHYFHHDFDALLESESLSGEPSLVGEEVPLLAVL